MSPSRAYLLHTAIYALYDGLAILFSLTATAWFIGGVWPDRDFFLEAAFTTSGFLGMLALTGVYQDEKSFLNIECSKRTLKGFLFGALGLGFALHALESHPVLLRSLPFAFASSFLLVFYGNIVLNEKLARLRRHFGLRMLIYGAGAMGREFFNTIGSPRQGIVPVGFVDDDPAKRGKLFESSSLTQRKIITVLGAGGDIPRLVRELSIDAVVVAFSNVPQDHMQERIKWLRGQSGAEVNFVPSTYSIPLHRLTISVLGDIPVARFRHTPRAATSWMKRALDVSLGAMMLAFAAPVLALAAVLIRLDSKGPVFFRQNRTGMNGELFTMYKLRTMDCAADPYALTPDSADDCRITRVGKLLRKTSIDELPQLFNVLRGDMSLVGPRPEMPFIAATYDETQRLRLAVRPGITGLWQISVDRNKPIHENLDYDLYYIRNYSFMLDITILLETLAFMVRGI